MSQRSDIGGAITALAAILLVTSLISAAFYYWPQYKVYQQRLEGMAELQRAESSRRIEVEAARAKLDAASLISKAEVERARGVAEANGIIANSLGGPEGYLRWRYIEMLSETGTSGTGSRDIIYIPTEAGLPILEAGRMGDFANE